MIKYEKLFVLFSATALVTSIAISAHSAPQGGVVSDGKALISQNGTKTDIHQSSHKAVLDWRSFDIAAGEHTQFHQPSSDAIALNRIHDSKASQIDGKITANGRIILINQNGMVFNRGSVIDVASLTASTADIDNDDFMAGKYNFKYPGQFDASIINKGLITAKESGLVTLVAPGVENHGVIAAKLSKVVW